jgi:hypothetical protein
MDYQTMSFDDWIIFVFDHPVSNYDPIWYYGIHFADPVRDTDLYPQTAIDYVIRLFESPVEPLAPYSDEQINQGLWFLVSNGGGDYLRVLEELTVTFEDKQRLVESVYSMYEKLFAERCTPTLSHRDEADSNPMNLICYMWWDLYGVFFRYTGEPLLQKLDEISLGILEKILYLEHDACIEGALHGLGHATYEYPERVDKIIATFLKNQQNLRPELKNYALSAQGGCIL